MGEQANGPEVFTCSDRAEKRDLAGRGGGQGGTASPAAMSTWNHHSKSGEGISGLTQSHWARRTPRPSKRAEEQKERKTEWKLEKRNVSCLSAMASRMIVILIFSKNVTILQVQKLFPLPPPHPAAQALSQFPEKPSPRHTTQFP